MKINLKRFYKQCLVIAFGMALLNVNADEPEQTAQLAYQAALTKVQMQNDGLLPDTQFSFVRSEENKEGELTQSQQVLLIGSNGAELLTSLPDKQIDDSSNLDTPEPDEGALQWSQSILVDVQSFDTRATLVRETETTWVFSINNMVRADLNSGDEESDDSLETEVAGVLQKVLNTEVTVSKANPQFLSLAVSAKHSFSPQFLATVEKFNVRVEFTEAWDKGPFIVKLVTREVEGSYALFMNINEFSTTRYSDFRLIEKTSIE